MEAPERSEAEIATELVERIGRGDRTAEEELVRRYSRGLLFHLRRMTRDRARADDLHQETFRVVLERLRDRGLDEPERLSGFLLGTGRNLFLGDWRKRSRRGETVDPGLEPGQVDAVDAGPDPHTRAVRQEQAAGVRRLLGELGTERDRQILWRFYLAEEDKETICRDLELSSLHFNRVLFRARQRLREVLEEHGWGDGREAAGG